MEEIEEEEGKERKTANSSPVDEEEEEEEGKGMMGSFHSSASSGSSTLDMMGRVVREGGGKEERRGRSKHQVLIPIHHHFETNIALFSQSLDSGIATRSVSSMSPEREDREEEEGKGKTNFAFDMDSENEAALRTSGLRGTSGGGTLKSLVVGNQRRRGSSETDIVSDIYTTAFSKVPKVRLSTAGENIF